MLSYILTAFGSDQPGLVSTLSGLIKDSGGNIEESRMLKMGNQFVMAVLISLTEAESYKFKSKITEFEYLNIQIHPTQKIDIKDTLNLKKFRLSGADNEGIVHSITRKLAVNKINIIELDTFIKFAPISATPLFNLNATIELPLNLSDKSLQNILDEHATKLGVNIDLQD